MQRGVCGKYIAHGSWQPIFKSWVDLAGPQDDVVGNSSSIDSE